MNKAVETSMGSQATPSDNPDEVARAIFIASMATFISLGLAYVLFSEYAAQFEHMRQQRTEGAFHFFRWSSLIQVAICVPVGANAILTKKRILPLGLGFLLFFVYLGAIVIPAAYSGPTDAVIVIGRLQEFRCDALLGSYVLFAWLIVLSMRSMKRGQPVRG